MRGEERRKEGKGWNLRREKRRKVRCAFSNVRRKRQEKGWKRKGGNELRETMSEGLWRKVAARER